LEILPCVKKRLEIGAKEGERNTCTWQLASYFMKRGLSLDECLKIMRDWWTRVDQGVYPFTWEECERSIRKVYEVGGYLVGCGSEFIEPFCVGKEKCPLFVRRAEQTVYDEFTREAAEHILRNTDPLDFIVEIIHLLHAGDDLLIKAEYISALSASLASSIGETINLWGIGRSGTGKTHSMNTLLKTLPKNYYEVFTSTSPKSYFYYVKQHGEDSLSDKLLFIDEAEASAEAEPVLRALTSRTEITPRHLSVYDSELLDLKIKGKRAVWFTTTRTFGTEQLHNRFMFINPEEEPEQDERVHELQKESHLDAPIDETPFKIAQCMTDIIIRETKNLPVFVPFEIKWPFKERRYLYPLFISFIKIIAKTRFKQRRIEQGYLIAERADFETAKEIWKTFEETIIHRVSTSAKKLLKYIPADREKAVTHAELADLTGYSTQRISQICQELLDAGLVNREKRGREGRGRSEWEYWLAEQPSTTEIEIEGELNLDDFRKTVEARRMEWKRFIDKLNFENLKTENGETEHQTKNVLDQKPLDPIFKFSKFNKPEPGTYHYLRVPPGEKCELCGAHPVEYEIQIDDGSILRRCSNCFEELRRMFTAVKWVEVEGPSL